MKYFFAPISREIHKAIHRLAASGFDVGIIASLGQVGNGAYTGYEYELFAQELLEFQHQYDTHGMTVERDHLKEDFDILRIDAGAGFNAAMLHLFDGQKIKEVTTAYADLGFEWQIGPGEDDSQVIDFGQVNGMLCNATWVSYPTGCRIDGLGNVGSLQKPRPIGLTDIKHRAHNCDYLPVHIRRKIHEYGYDGMQIAPQLGVVQSTFYLTAAAQDGLRIDRWLNAMERSPYRPKWTGDKILCGHYHFDEIPWRSAYTERMEDFMYLWMKNWIKDGQV